jgi:Spindle and kinetochore-associated protein 1
MLASLRGKGSSMSKLQREHAYNVSMLLNQQPTLKSRFFFLESDLKDGAAVKRDKSGKSLLQLLRHLKRISEVGTLGLTLSAGHDTPLLLAAARQGLCIRNHWWPKFAWHIANR